MVLFLIRTCVTCVICATPMRRYFLLLYQCFYTKTQSCISLTEAELLAKNLNCNAYKSYLQKLRPSRAIRFVPSADVPDVG